MSKPNKAKPGCFYGFLHLLLCEDADGNGDGNNHSPSPLQPSSHHITQSYVTEMVHHPTKAANASMVDDHVAIAPGVIARLMGLDSLPKNNNNENTNFVFDSFPRSKSVNFVDYMLKYDTARAASDSNHRRAKTSASFKEVQQLFQQQKNHKDQEKQLSESRNRRKKVTERDNKVAGNNKERNQGKKSKKISELRNEARMIPAAKKRRSSMVQSRKADEPSASVSSRKSGSRHRLQDKQKKGFEEPKQVKNTRKERLQMKIEAEFSTEDLSPVSVLDNNDYAYLYGPDFLDYKSSLVSKPKWESSELLFLCEDRASKNKKGYAAYPHISKEKEFFSELELKLRALTENDTRDSDSTHTHVSETECFQEVCVVYEHNIFEILLNEVVNELVELSC